MRQPAPAIVACLIAALLGVATASSPEVPVFRSSTGVVRIDVAVTRKGRPVTGLTRSHFRVRDRGRLQDIEVARAVDIPLRAVLVLDLSGSVQGRGLEHLKGAVRSFLRGFSPADCATLVGFRFEARQHTTDCATPDSILGALESLGAHSATALRDAIFLSLALAEPGRERTVLLVLSDGIDNSSWLEPDEVVGAAQTSEATVYAVVIEPPEQKEWVVHRPRTGSLIPWRPPGADRTSAFLDRVVGATGGRRLSAEGDVDLEAAFATVLEDLRNRYLLSYGVGDTPDPGWHQLEVRLVGVSADVRARRGYLVPE